MSDDPFGYYKHIKDMGFDWGKSKRKNKMDNKTLYLKAIEKWGVTSQIDLAQEECAELIQAISKYKRFGNIHESAIIEELADVSLMVEQLVLIFGNEKFHAARKFKLKKLQLMLYKD